MLIFRRSAGTAVLEAAPVAVTVATPPASLPRISAVPSMTDQQEREKYVKMAQSLGVVNGALKQEMLLHFLKESGLGFFSYEKVEAHLDDMFGRAKDQYNPTWGWRALRQEDAGKLARDKNAVRLNPNNNFLQNTYQKAVPMPVLLTVQRIAEAVPGVHFYVSDQVTESDKTDPFLAVAAIGMPMYVVERWDEPSFRP